jgi:cytidylate kinase
MIGIEVLCFGDPYTPPVVVTVSSEYGSGAVGIAAQAAHELGYELVDHQLPVVVARRMSVPVEEVESSEDMGRSLAERLLTGLEMGTPELAQASVEPPFDKEMLEAVQQTVREYAAHDRVIIVGRAAAIVLGRDLNVLRVFAYAPRAWRVQHIVAAMHLDEKTAMSEIDRIDRARATYLRDWYGAGFGDPHHYDLCIDASRFSQDEAVALITGAVSARDRA